MRQLGSMFGIMAAAAMSVGQAVVVFDDAPSPKRRKPATKSQIAYYRGLFSPTINRHTGKPHTHARAIARRTTKAGSPERAAAYAALKR